MNYDVGVVIRRLLLSPEPMDSMPGVSAAAGAWYTLYAHTLATETVDNNGFTIRTAVSASVYDGGAPATGTKLRLTIQAGSTLAMTWDSMYIGHAAASGDAWDFDGTQVQLLFSGSGGGTIALGTTLVSDAVTYSFDKTKPLVVSTHISASSKNASHFSVTGVTSGYKGAVSEAGVTDVSGYTSDPGGIYIFPLVEVFG